jgi:phosphate acyltransferase
MRIAIDAMGGDDGPRSIIDGALVAARHLQIGLLLVGATADIERELGRHPRVASLDVRILDTPESIGMGESAAAALRRKPRASIRLAADAVREGQAAALFSAGHTGASVMAALGAFGRLPGVDRPALATTIPTLKNPAILLDSGATVECRPQHLVQFATMGAAYARVALGCALPRVGLLSVGAEESKGNELTREAHQLLKSAPIEFVGNVEGRDVYAGDVDVIVCDGFTGNVALKISEGLVELFEGLMSKELSVMTDYSEYGGAPLLGVNGVAIVGHGRSSAKAIRNGIAMAHRFASAQLLQRVETGIAASAVPHQ